jgi:hypothetical protein
MLHGNVDRYTKVQTTVTAGTILLQHASDKQLTQLKTFLPLCLANSDVSIGKIISSKFHFKMIVIVILTKMSTIPGCF